MDIMEETRYPVKFICDHDCDHCLITELSHIYDIKDVNSLRSCQGIVKSWFGGTVITREKYNEIIKYAKDTEDFFNDYEKFNCPSTKNCNLCKSCEVYDYLTSLGYEAGGLTNAKYRNFKIPHKQTTKRCNSCVELMKKLCGVEIYRKTFTEIPEISIESINAFKDNLSDIIQHWYDVQNHECKPGEIISKDAIRPYEGKYAHKTVKECQQDRIERLYFQYPSEYEKEKPSESKEWVPPFKYVGDADALSAFAREYVKLRDDIYLFFGESEGHKFINNAKLTMHTISEGRDIFKKAIETIHKDELIRFSKNVHDTSSKAKQKYYDRFKDCLFDFEDDAYYYNILEAPVCCGNCNECLIYHNIYKHHGVATKRAKDMTKKCNYYAEKYADEIAELFDYTKVKDYISLDNIYRLMIVNYSVTIKLKLRQIIVEKQLKERNIL